MADVKQMRIFCAEQIEVPSQLPEILKNYSKAVIRNNPADIVDFSRKYNNYFLLVIIKNRNFYYFLFEFSYFFKLY